MALSNIGREPRREIIEQVIGTAFVVGYLIADYHFARWVYAPKHFWEDPGDLALMVLGLLFIPVGLMLLVFTHWVGEEICALLKSAGIDPRPTQRY